MANSCFNSIRKIKIYWLLWGLLLFVWSLFCFSYLGEYAYRYPFIHNYRVLLFSTIPNLLLPLLPLVVAFFCLKNKKKGIGLICVCVVVIAMPFAWLSMARELLYTPAIFSYTEDPKNYGQYDKDVYNLVNLNGKGYFPDTIPSEAKNVRYQYLYEKASADTVYISVSWDSMDGEMQNIQNKYATSLWEIWENGRKVVYLSEKTLSGNIQPCLHAVIVLDEVNNVVTYIMTNKTGDGLHEPF